MRRPVRVAVRRGSVAREWRTAPGRVFLLLQVSMGGGDNLLSGNLQPGCSASKRGRTFYCNEYLKDRWAQRLIAHVSNKDSSADYDHRSWVRPGLRDEGATT
ncbi:hypothetical protein EVAR_31809_1 [Eumeta japonica]|uniref:Uncharacterized protein n=1 Tax=Eumeta variegata TaxID=151549 RepID=A0A4C1W5T4_EUMVA|nr:hypothetical protein EVAR_31809_1 [Eumeta japonica]